MSEPHNRRPSPNVGGPAEVFAHERASATPSPTVLRPRREVERAARVVTPSGGALRTVQAWFAEVVTHPESVSAGIAAAGAGVNGAQLGIRDDQDIERLVTKGPRLSALDRLDIYFFGYKARLVECLIDDFPAVRYALGEDAFEELSRAYINAHPSRSPSLNGFGRMMPQFLASYPHEHARFLADLAALEWAMVEVLHAEAAPTLTQESLNEIPPDRWGEARLPPSKTVRVLRFRYPVNAYFQAFRNDAEPQIPSEEASATAVYRVKYAIWRMDLTPLMCGLLEALYAGARLGDALEAIATDADSADALAEAERNVMVWFREWVAAGFFARIDVGKPGT